MTVTAYSDPHGTRSWNRGTSGFGYDPELQEPAGRRCATTPKFFAVHPSPSGLPAGMDQEEGSSGELFIGKLLRRNYIGDTGNIFDLGQNAFFRLTDQGRFAQAFPNELYAFKEGDVEDFDYVHGGRFFDVPLPAQSLPVIQQFIPYWVHWWRQTPTWPVSGSTQKRWVSACLHHDLSNPNVWYYEIWDALDLPVDAPGEDEPAYQPLLVARWKRSDSPLEFSDPPLPFLPQLLPPTDQVPFVWNTLQRFYRLYPTSAGLPPEVYVTPFYP